MSEEKRFKKFPNMDDKEFWTEPSRKLPIIDGQKPDRAFHAVKYVATVLGWRGDTAQKLREMNVEKWVKEHIATDTIREDEGILSEYANVLSLFIEKELLEALEK